MAKYDAAVKMTAIAAVQAGTKLSAAALEYSIPESTLRFWVNAAKKNPIEVTSPDMVAPELQNSLDLLAEEVVAEIAAEVDAPAPEAVKEIAAEVVEALKIVRSSRKSTILTSPEDTAAVVLEAFSNAPTVPAASVTSKAVAAHRKTPLDWDVMLASKVANLFSVTLSDAEAVTSGQKEKDWVFVGSLADIACAQYEFAFKSLKKAKREFRDNLGTERAMKMAATNEFCMAWAETFLPTVADSE